MIIHNQKELDNLISNATPEIKAQFAAQTDSQLPRIVTPVIKSTSPQWVKDALAERAKAKQAVPITERPAPTEHYAAVTSIAPRKATSPNLNKLIVLGTFILIFTVLTFLSVVALIMQLKGLLP